jgi:hypothetical protein
MTSDCNSQIGIKPWEVDQRCRYQANEGAKTAVTMANRHWLQFAMLFLFTIIMKVKPRDARLRPAVLYIASPLLPPPPHTSNSMTHFLLLALYHL